MYLSEYKTHVVMAGVLKAIIFKNIYYYTKFKGINKTHQRELTSPGVRKPFTKVSFKLE